MSRLKVLVGATCSATLLTAGAAAQGLVPDRTTFVTISAPVSLPGTVLPAGTYMFRLADTQANRNVIQIFDKERSKIFATLLTVSAERNEVSNDAVITFRETEATAPPALRFWYYAGEKMGHEFVYPKDQAMMIARASGESVLAIDTTSSDMEAMTRAEISRVDAAAARAQAQPAPAEQSTATAQSSAAGAQSEQAAASTQAAAVEQPERPVESSAAQPSDPVGQTAATTQQPTEPAAAPRASSPAQAQAERPAAPTAGMTGSAPAEPQPTGTSGREIADSRGEARSDASRELPRTASELPVLTLVGFLALGAYFGARALRRGLIV